MDLTKAVKLFEELKQRIDQHGKYLRESEYRTRILLVDPLLRILGWNVEDFHCVEIEFRTSQSVQERADYVLKNGESKVAIVEAKRLGTVVSSTERRQAKEYADYADASQCVLTDGAKWMLYDLDQGRNPDKMKPKVEFDIENDMPEQLVLRCLALWRSNFTSAIGSTLVSNLAFDLGVDNDQSETNRTTSEQQEPQLTDDTPTDLEKCYSFASERRYPPETTPIRLKIGDRIEKQVTFWLDVIHEIAVWLVDEGMLSDNDCPILISKRPFIDHKKAANPDGTPLKNPKPLSNNLILQRGGADTWEQWERLRKLLEQFKVDPHKIEVFYKSKGI